MILKEFLKLADRQQLFKISFSVYTIRELPAFTELFNKEHYEPDRNIIKGTASFLLSRLPSRILEERIINEFKVDEGDPRYIKI